MARSKKAEESKEQESKAMEPVAKKAKKAEVKNVAKKAKKAEVKKVELYEGLTHIPFGLKGVNYERGQKFVTEDKDTFDYLKGKFLIK
jgi:hypothetical protein